MKYRGTLLAVKDLKRSVDFYCNVLGLHVVLDYDTNKTLSGGVVLQSADTWNDFVEENPIVYGSGVYILYFEEENFDAFAEKLRKLNIIFVNYIKEDQWGQRVLRFYDPDHHIIEVAENIKSVCYRFLDNGMSKEAVSKRMGLPLKYVKSCLT